MPCCCAINCANKSGVRFYRLPKKNKELRQQWINNIGRAKLTEHARLCEKHFEEDQFEKREDKSLRWNAIPTIFNFSSDTDDVFSSAKRIKIDSCLDNMSTIAESVINSPNDIHEDCQTEIKNLKDQLEAANKKIRLLTEHNTNLIQNLHKMFEPDQMKLLSKPADSQIKWSSSSIRKSLKLYLTCGTTGYEELRKQNYPIPSVRTLQRKMQSFKCMPEIHREIFDLLEIKIENMLPEERHFALLIDEMAIKPGYQFDNNSE